MSFFRKLMGWVSGRDQRAFLDAIHQLRREVFEVPLDKARQQAIEHLSDASKFRRVLATSELVVPNHVSLPPLVTEFFSRYDEIEECRGDVRLSRDEIARSQIHSSYTRIGTSTVHTEIVVRGPAEDVYTMDGSETEAAAGSLNHYPTVYHFVLFNVRLLDPAWSIAR